MIFDGGRDTTPQSPAVTAPLTRGALGRSRASTVNLNVTEELFGMKKWVVEDWEFELTAFD